MAETANRSRGSGRRVRGAFAPEARCGYRNPTLSSIFGNADAVPQLPERCLSRKARIVRCCLSFLRIWEILFGGFGAACASYSRGLSVSLESAGSFYFASGWFGRGNILDFWWVGMMAWDGFLCRVVGRNFPLRIMISHTSTP